MLSVNSGIVNQSLKNLDQVLLAATAFLTRMGDAGRIRIIDEAEKNLQRTYNDLKAFNNQNIALSLQRAREKEDIQTVKNLYGLP